MTSKQLKQGDRFAEKEKQSASCKANHSEKDMKLTAILYCGGFAMSTTFTNEEKTVEAGPNGKPKSVKVTKKHVPPDAQLAADILLLMRCGRW